LLFQQKFNDLAVGVIFFTDFISYYELKIYCKDYITLLKGWSKIILSFLYFGSKV